MHRYVHVYMCIRRYLCIGYMIQVTYRITFILAHMYAHRYTNYIKIHTYMLLDIHVDVKNVFYVIHYFYKNAFFKVFYFWIVFFYFLVDKSFILLNPLKSY